MLEHGKIFEIAQSSEKKGGHHLFGVAGHNIGTKLGRETSAIPVLGQWD